jgi:hypothetical protein
MSGDDEQRATSSGDEGGVSGYRLTFRSTG